VSRKDLLLNASASASMPASDWEQTATRLLDGRVLVAGGCGGFDAGCFDVLASAEIYLTALRGGYDGNGKADIAVYRSSTGRWFIQRSSDGLLADLAWGCPSCNGRAVPAHYDGDRKADIAAPESGSSSAPRTAASPTSAGAGPPVATSRCPPTTTAMGRPTSPCTGAARGSGLSSAPRTAS
jgi:hypothetical protein